MKFDIVFNNSGDVIPFESTNDKVLEYYLDLLNKNKINSFSQKNPTFGQKLNQTIENLNSIIDQTNTWLPKLINRTIDVFEHDQYLNQNNLNKLHADWVNSHSIVCETHINYADDILCNIHDLFPDNIQKAALGSILSKLNLLENYVEINVNVHKIEGMFNNIDFSITERPWVEFHNPFTKDLLSHDKCNLQMPFHHLGRTLYNKYKYSDNNLEYDDENSFDQFLGFVSLNLSKPESFTPSKEYSDWCKVHNRNPIGDELNLGNILNLEEKLLDYRLIIYRNLSNNNNFSIQIH
jgi:hypothetical protein